jgi:hypothetical protein
MKRIWLDICEFCEDNVYVIIGIIVAVAIMFTVTHCMEVN